MAAIKTATFTVDTITPPSGDLGLEFYHILGDIDGNKIGTTTSVVATKSTAPCMRLRPDGLHTG